MQTLLGSWFQVVNGGAYLSGIAALTTNCTLFTISLSTPSCSSHRTPFDAVEQKTIARILFWNPADASCKNSSVWRAHHGYFRFILDSEENPLTHVASTNTFSDQGTYRRGILERP